MSKIDVSLAETDQDLIQILILQEENHKSNFAPNGLPSDGFVTVKHDLELLRKMNQGAKQIIAKDGDLVVGYALVMLESFQEMIPVLRPMFELFGQLSIEGKPVKSYQYYVIGQICVAADYRGMGIFDQLYAQHKNVNSDKYDFCITEISTKNKRSLRAHERVGFKTIHLFTDTSDEWAIVYWDWK